MLLIYTAWLWLFYVAETCSQSKVVHWRVILPFTVHSRSTAGTTHLKIINAILSQFATRAKISKFAESYFKSHKNFFYFPLISNNNNNSSVSLQSAYCTRQAQKPTQYTPYYEICFLSVNFNNIPHCVLLCSHFQKNTWVKLMDLDGVTNL